MISMAGVLIEPQNVERLLVCKIIVPFELYGSCDLYVKIIVEPPITDSPRYRPPSYKDKQRTPD